MCIRDRLRWARNPRVGEYSFLLVVVPEDAFTAARIPDAVARINEQENGQFIEPYWYFLHGPGAKLPQVTVLEARERLKVSARPPLGAGIYVEETEGISKGAFSDRCGQTEELRKQAPFKQFIHYVDPSTRFANIPLIADVLGNAYTPEAVSYTHLRAHETVLDLVCRLLLEKKKSNSRHRISSRDLTCMIKHIHIQERTNTL